ncbi:MAG: hypothetical protein WAM72_02120 [Xanthobacteraceae bacterium]
MLQTVSPLVLQLTLFLMTAVATHLVMSFGQTLIHYKVAHHPMGGKIFRNHINFHHTHYSDAHLLSRTYLGDEGNTTPYFFNPSFLVGGCAYFLLPLNLFVVMVIASAASFYAHVFFDKQYHVEGSRRRHPGNAMSAFPPKADIVQRGGNVPLCQKQTYAVQQSSLA